MRIITGCLLAVALLASTGCTVGAYGAPRYEAARSYARAAYDRGYHDGFAAGERDARDGSRYDHRRDRLYRDGVYGSNPRLGSRGEYRRLYREGFEAGYRDGYARAARHHDRRGRYGYFLSAARERGFADGYEKGREDGRDRDRFAPRRHKWYREGDRGYRREYGPRDVYERAYREAFVQGYERGYREARWY